MSRQRKRKGEPVSGWLNFIKPADMTSTQAVGFLKRVFNAEKAGHAGTLDPLADGVLPIAFGEATKTVPWAMDCEKEYRFTIQWGVSTASIDAEGAVTATSDVRPARAAIEAALQGFSGVISQVPPNFSAIRTDGARAYDRARDGEVFELEARDVTVYAAALEDLPDADHCVLRVRSGKGFYVRAMARDLAAALGTEGHIVQLRRTLTGVFKYDRGVTKAEIEALGEDTVALKSLLQPLQSVLTGVPVLKISAPDVTQLRLGRSIVLLPHVVESWRAARGTSEDRLVLVEHDGVAIALGEVRAGQFEPGRVFQYG